MKRLALALILLSSAEVWGAEGAAIFYNGNQIMDLCANTKRGESNENPAKYNRCVHYLAGILDATIIWQNWEDIKPRELCAPKGLSSEQLPPVVLRYMVQRPAEWHVAAASLALNAFMEAWPCK